MKTFDGASYRAEHFLWEVQDGIATLTLNRPERKNPLTFDSYGELRDLFRELRYSKDVKVVVIRGAGDNFCSGGDVHEIIGPLVRMQENDDMPGLLVGSGGCNPHEDAVAAAAAAAGPAGGRLPVGGDLACQGKLRDQPPLH